ncbi:Peroxisomal adenine nucleotide carrier-like protein [Emericellopsis cladophorae]|uniref:Peroxisomal adenine nucleotide carrier-like protein n=1 Tax=Emericellopsis cladophorae TaxID=2686198 RepID=A0A9P9XX82_9HYPO|nr:Peroxisomal adenine nucleotide carrier-like protein [Emericellopsis cladophorae]KAI6779518.1 Peroxisomal adenine nucleotide carrier-like protein [Emericellopsis cladophorae]
MGNTARLRLLVLFEAMSRDALLNALGHASSGSAGTAISTAAVYPLDLVTTRLKAQRHVKSSKDHPHYDGIISAFKDITSREGASALYSGLGTDVGKSVVDSFLFFGFYNYLQRYSRHPPRALEELALGSLAGACAKAFTTPMSNVVARKQTQSEERTVRQILADIYHEGGLLGLWSGYSATLVLTLNPSITFFVNRRLAKKVIPALEEEDIPIAWAAFLLAALSKATATALTYPFQTGKTRLQLAAASTEAEATDDEKEKKSDTRDRCRASIAARLRRIIEGTIFGVIVRIVHREGLKALYDGLSGELLKSFFSHGATMFTKGLLHRLIIRLWLVYSPQMRRRLQKR